jgi:maltokinase
MEPTGAPRLFRPGDGSALHAGIDADLCGQLLTSMAGARWFAGKGRLAELTGLTRLPWLTGLSEWPAVRLEVAEITYVEDQDPEPEDAESTEEVAPYELYQLAIAYYPAPQPGLQHAELARFADSELGSVVAYDAMQDPQSCRVILRELLAGRHVRGPDARVRFQLSDQHALTADLEPLIFTGQQSNTSVMFGDVAMIKLFRRLEIGHNLDIEVHDALNRVGIADVAKLYGWVDATWRHRAADVTADLALVVEKLADAEDGWGFALDSLREGRSFAEEAGRLGSALADIHQGLRAAFGTDRHSGAAAGSIMKDRLDVARSIAPALDSYAGGLRACFDQLGAVTLDTQRVHGDFHLGQTLHTPGGWKIIDFEGEPAKSMAERVAPDSIWRDIAGMLRSFDYAAASVPGPGSAAWAAACRQAFLKGYAGGDLDRDAAAPLRAYEAEKAIYEVGYEVRNRPDWVAIPLGAIAGLADEAWAGGTAMAIETDHEPGGDPVSPTTSATTEQE